MERDSKPRHFQGQIRKAICKISKVWHWLTFRRFRNLKEVIYRKCHQLANNRFKI